MPQNGPIQGLEKYNKVTGSSTKKSKVNLANTYGILVKGAKKAKGK